MQLPLPSENGLILEFFGGFCAGFLFLNGTYFDTISNSYFEFSFYTRVQKQGTTCYTQECKGDPHMAPGRVAGIAKVMGPGVCLRYQRQAQGAQERNESQNCPRPVGLPIIF